MEKVTCDKHIYLDKNVSYCEIRAVPYSRYENDY